MGRYKEGSRIALVYSVFEKKGGQAAFDYGRKLEDKLKVITLKLWVHVWSKERGEKSPIAHLKAPPEEEAHRGSTKPKEKAVKGKAVKPQGPIEQREKVRPPVVKPPKKPKAERGPLVMQTKPLVTVSYAKPGKNKAYLIDEGPQASLIRFAHDETEQCISNEWIGLEVKKAKPKPIEKEERQPKGDTDEQRKRYLLD